MWKPGQILVTPQKCRNVVNLEIYEIWNTYMVEPHAGTPLASFWGLLQCGKLANFLYIMLFSTILEQPWWKLTLATSIWYAAMICSSRSTSFCFPPVKVCNYTQNLQTYPSVIKHGNGHRPFTEYFQSLNLVRGFPSHDWFPSHVCNFHPISDRIFFDLCFNP